MSVSARAWILAAAVAGSLAFASAASGQSGELPETLRLPPGGSVTGTAVYKAGVAYKLDIAGQMKRASTTSSEPQSKQVDAFYCFAGEPAVVCSKPEEEPAIYVRTSGDPAGNRSQLPFYLEPRKISPPYRGDHSYSVTFVPYKDGRVQLSTTEFCSQFSSTVCSGEGFTVTFSEPTATLSALERKVEVQPGEAAWEPATAGMKLRQGDKIHTGFKAGVTLTFPDGSTVRVAPMSLVELQELSRGAGDRLRVRLFVRLGELAATVNRSPGAQGDFQVKTPTTVASVRGTKFSVLYDGTATFVAVTESSALVTAKNGRKVVVPAGKETRSTAKSVSAPVAIGRGEKRGGLTAAEAGKRLAAKLAKGLKGCRFDVVSSRLAPAKGGWSGSFVIVGARQGIDDKPKGTAKFRLKGKRVSAANALAKRIAHGCG